MKVFLCGQKHFGWEVYKLLQGMECVELVGVSAPLIHKDGRDDRLHKFATLDGKVPVISSGLNSKTLPEGIDLIVAAHSYDFISAKMLNKTKLGAIGYHPSLLPRHRGRDAIRWAIKMGDVITGGSVYWLNQNVDAGAIAAQDWCWVTPEDDATSLWQEKLQPMGLRLLEKVIKDIDGGTLVRIPQDEAIATWEPSWERAPIPRPDLLQLGGAIDGYKVVVKAEDSGARFSSPLAVE